jgi:molybdopterin molybdotransferase
MTGSPIPYGADAVIPIEDTDQYDLEFRSEPRLPEEIEVYRSVEPCDYVRKQGEDISKGETVLGSNSRLRPRDVGLLAMLGKVKLSVYRHPRIVILSA